MQKLLKLILLSLLFLGILQSNVSAVDTAQQTAFVERFYQNILNRTADEGGMATWLNTIQTESATNVALGFFNGTEFANLNLSNEGFVDILYRTLFDREADYDGRTYWIDKLNANTSKDEVMYGFFNGTEFKNLADSYGVTAIRDEDQLDYNPYGTTGVNGYVNRFYTLVLNRTPDDGGFNDWTTQLNAGTKGGGDIAKGFFNSTEYTNRELDNSTFLDICYKAFFDREADEGGKSNWTTLLNQGASNDTVLDGFIGSVEFATLAESFGIRTVVDTNDEENTDSEFANVTVTQLANFDSSLLYCSPNLNGAFFKSSDTIGYTDGTVSGTKTVLNTDIIGSSAFPIIKNDSFTYYSRNKRNIINKNLDNVSVPDYEATGSVDLSNGNIVFPISSSVSSDKHPHLMLFDGINTTELITFPTYPTDSNYNRGYGDITIGTNFVNFSPITESGNYVFVRLRYDLGLGVTKYEDYVTDGTSSGTKMIYSHSESFDYISTVGEKILFSKRTGDVSLKTRTSKLYLMDIYGNIEEINNTGYNLGTNKSTNDPFAYGYYQFLAKYSNRILIKRISFGSSGNYINDVLVIDSDRNNVVTLNDLNITQLGVFIFAKDYFIIKSSGLKIVNKDGTIFDLALNPTLNETGVVFGAYLNNTDETTFGARDTNGEYKLWITDGTLNGTKVLFDPEINAPILNIIATKDGKSIFFKIINTVYKYSKIDETTKKVNIEEYLLNPTSSQVINSSFTSSLSSIAKVCPTSDGFISRYGSGGKIYSIK